MSAKTTRPAALLLLALALLGLRCARGGEQETPPLRPHPAGVPARGQALDDRWLDEALPPPPRDAVAYEVRDPLRNGRTVAVKKRWLWIPDGKRLEATPAAAGLALKVPVGTKLWKEFYVGAGGAPTLVERRLLLKVADRDDQNGWLLNGGWRFYTAHHLPASADGVSGYQNRLGEQPLAPYAFQPEQWLPTRVKPATTTISFSGQPYVFPGKVNCDLCHGGAAGAYSEPERQPVLAFGSHPGALTAESIKALVQRGWLVLSEEQLRALREPPRLVKGAGEAAQLGERVLALFRMNCLSCHNTASLAAAHDTGFVLAPGRPYSLDELRRALGGKSRVMGALARPVLSPGQPAQSELVLRLRGLEGRRRMPPAEGGVPEPDAELGELVSGFISRL